MRDERRPVPVSAITGVGLEQLLQAIDERLGRADEVLDLNIPGHEGALIAWLYENSDVLTRETAENGVLHMRVRVASEKKARIIGQLRKAGLAV